MFLVRKGHYAAWFEIWAALLVTVEVFWDMTHCQIAVSYRRLGRSNNTPRQLISQKTPIFMACYLSRPWSGLAYSQQPQLMCLTFHCHCLRLQTTQSTFCFIHPGEGLDVAVQTTIENILRSFCLNLLAPELFFLILAPSIYKMWIIQEPNELELWNKLHFKEKKTESIHHV